MFDFSLAELLLIVVVAVVFIGPKELPMVLKTVAKAMKGMRSLTREIHDVFDELSRESGLKDTADAFHREIHQEMRMIKGEDGKYYESYTVPVAKPISAPAPVEIAKVPPVTEDQHDG